MQTTAYNRSSETSKRKSLRSRMNNAETLLWSRLRARKLDGYKFRRQHGFDQYVVDFYCPEFRLAVEIDGQTHFLDEQEIRRDKSRQLYLESQFGLNFLRISNKQVLESLDGVEELIRNKIKGIILSL